MDSEQHGGSGGTRRKFLRQVGMTAAATAAFAGITDAAGLPPAAAGTRGAHPGIKPMALVRAMPASKLPPTQAKQVQEVRARWAQEAVGTKRVDAGAYYCYCTPGQCGGPCHPNGVYCHYCYNVAGFCLVSGYYCIEGCGTQQANCQ